MTTLFLLCIISYALGYCGKLDAVTGDACAKVYKGKHCNGDALNIDKNEKTGRIGKQWDNQISSLVVNRDDNCVLQVFIKWKFKGYSLNFRGIESDLSRHKYRFFWFFRRSWNNKISSWKCRCDRDGGRKKAGNGGAGGRGEPGRERPGKTMSK